MKRIETAQLLVGLALFTPAVQAGVLVDPGCVTNMRQSTPDSRFEDNGNGTVTDLVTQLMWSKCSDGQTYNQTNGGCDGTATELNWQTALQNADALNYAGHTDWRLPNVKELYSLVETACVMPAINSTFFPGTSTESYWTSSQAGANLSWSLGFGLGIINDLYRTETATTHVRYVRDLP